MMTIKIGRIEKNPVGKNVSDEKRITKARSLLRIRKKNINMICARKNAIGLFSIYNHI